MRNSTSRSDIAFHFHSQTDPRRHEDIGPLVVVQGEGARVRDAEGKSYFDGMASLWCASLGFSHPRLRAAADRQMAELATYHSFNHRTNLPAISVAETISELAGWPEAKVFFTNSGSDANDTMVKMAWYYHAARGRPGKRRIISRTGAFHGSTVMGAALSGLPHMHRMFNLPDLGVIFAATPDTYRGRRKGESDADLSARLAAELEAQIIAEEPDTIAAMILEPVMGAGGVLVPPEGYLPAIETVLRRHDILMLCDEVVCGFGRTGAWFGHQTMGASPDMMSTAKALTSGYVPMGAVVMRDAVYQAIADAAHEQGIFGHGFTYSAHPLGAAVAQETLDIYREIDAPACCAVLGAVLGRELDRALGAHRNLGDIRRCGFVAGVELVEDRDTARAFAPERQVGRRVEQACRNRGLILRNMGDTISICPPLTVSEAELAWLADTLAEAVEAVCAEETLERTEA